MAVKRRYSSVCFEYRTACEQKMGVKSRYFEYSVGYQILKAYRRYHISRSAFFMVRAGLCLKTTFGAIGEKKFLLIWF